MSKKCRAYSESKLGLEPPDNRKSFYAGWDAALRAALAQQGEPVEPVAWLVKWANAYDGEAYTEWQKGYDAARSVVKAHLPVSHTQSHEPEQAEPTGKESLQVESVVAENATAQQQIEQTPPSEYGRGYWDGFNIGKREGRIEAGDELAQQAEPVALKHRHEWFRTGGMEPGQFRCIHCGVWGQEQTDPQIEDRLARHGINPCPDCRGIGYDASGQLCWCQQNPSF